MLAEAKPKAISRGAAAGSPWVPAYLAGLDDLPSILEGGARGLLGWLSNWKAPEHGSAWGPGLCPGPRSGVNERRL